MHNLFIFGIGGTGARVIRALNMLLAANGGYMEDTKVFPIIIDYDVKNGDKTRALESLKLYNKVHKDIYTGTTFDEDHPEKGFFASEVLEMKEALKAQGGQSTFNLQYNPPSTAKKYSDSIGHSALNGDLQITQNLLETLYNNSQDQEFAELHIDTTVGFRGNPNIGSVMLNNLHKSKEFKEFSSLCNGLGGDRVVIIGSLFGGTGSSGIPVLVNAIRNSQRAGVNSAKIATILVCPYFKIGAPDDSKRQEGVIDDKIFESKTKAALYYYQDALNEKIDSIYYLGDNDKNTLQHNVGKEEQKNPAHLVELVSAMAVTHFSSLSEDDMKSLDGEGKRKNHWKYGFDLDIDNVRDIDFSMFAKENGKTVNNDIKHLIAFALAGRVLRDYIIGSNKDCSSANFYKVTGLDKDVAAKSNLEKKFHSTVTDFLSYFQSYVEWMAELENGSAHRLINFDFNSDELCDLLKTHPFRKEKKTIFGKSEMIPTLNSKDLFSEMSSAFKKDQMPEGKSDNVLPTVTLSYAFFRSLYVAACKIVDEKLNLKK